MAWLGKVSLGGFPDLAGAVSKLSESVKNIEKNFDSALGLEENQNSSDEGPAKWPPASDNKGIFEPMMTFMGHKGQESASEASLKAEFLSHPSSAEEYEQISAAGSPVSTVETTTEKLTKDFISHANDTGSNIASIMVDKPGEVDRNEVMVGSNCLKAETETYLSGSKERPDSFSLSQHKTDADGGTNDKVQPRDCLLQIADGEESIVASFLCVAEELQQASDLQGSNVKNETEAVQIVDEGSPMKSNIVVSVQEGLEIDTSVEIPVSVMKYDHANELSDHSDLNPISTEQHQVTSSESVTHDTDVSPKSMEVSSKAMDVEAEDDKSSVGASNNKSNSMDPIVEVEKVKQEMKMMEAALQGAARQAQAKADEIAKLMNENERLKSIIEDLKRKSSEAEIDALREEYHQKVSSLERKVYALTRERDTLRREQTKKNDATALLKEKDEIISQIRELEEEKQRLNSKLQVEVTKVESIKRDKAATEKMLQETIERNQAELAAQKEFYTKALNEAKEAEAMAEARANTEARVEVESRLREAVERETMLVQTLKELRQSLTRTEQQAVSREEILQRDIEDLQKRYQASELHYTELITQVPKSTQPLLRQIEAMQETATRREEAWAGVERVLNSRLLEAEAKAAAAEEKERALNDRISQSLSRITVLETQISCIRAEQTQLSRSLEKERQRASESRQEYLAAMEEAATQEGRAKQLEDEIKEIRSEHKKELQDEVAHRELLEKELERLRTAQTELEKTISRETPPVANQDQTKNLPIRKLSSAGSLSSMDESIFLHTSLDFSDSFPLERRPSAEGNISPYFWKSMTQSAYEVALRQKDGELASYMSRLASLESVCNSLAEELVKMTEQCEKLRAEAGVLPGLRAELEALRQRHSTALELMGEHDEELEELQADIIDLKEMYREQVDLLVNRIQTMTLSAGAT
ncbi:TATA element modulatory factor 1 TATA binding [Musa troglodytarum]|uniref:TATA element modulatory factor 1 TATA binding n=1 Tax=Musa troglodytarum TaxID=320322 RepID=A0A9E7F1T5_9LILI|nr:TATA element modulatory factor 1 TATA binding [Musa troglodytarum]URD88196.1 TATA element modulatory factor 1 TATA binding [Musa troglodytarum]